MVRVGIEETSELAVAVLSSECAHVGLLLLVQHVSRLSVVLVHHCAVEDIARDVDCLIALLRVVVPRDRCYTASCLLASVLRVHVVVRGRCLMRVVPRCQMVCA